MALSDARGDTERFTPIIARTRSVRQPIAPIAYDCVKLIFVRHGSAILLTLQETGRTRAEHRAAELPDTYRPATGGTSASTAIAQ